MSGAGKTSHAHTIYNIVKPHKQIHQHCGQRKAKQSRRMKPSVQRIFHAIPSRMPASTAGRLPKLPQFT